MRKQYIYYLKVLPNARFHFGETSKESSLSSSSSYAYSDTLVGAILHNAFLLNQEKAKFLLEEIHTGKIELSSAFFYIKKPNLENVIFLPKPIVFDSYRVMDGLVDPKKIKNVEMISKGVWELGLKPESWFDNTRCGSLQNGKFIYLKDEGDFDEDAFVYSKSVTPKVPISYTDNEDDKRKIYYQNDVFLSRNNEFSSGYYFLLNQDIGEESMAFLDESIKLITTFGLGGDRSTGAGQIAEIEKQPFEWESKIEHSSVSNLSLLIPKNETDYRKGRYKVITRGGQDLNKKERLKYIQCIVDGGVFPNKVGGKLVTIGTDKLKNGTAYFAPFSTEIFEL